MFRKGGTFLLAFKHTILIPTPGNVIECFRDRFCDAVMAARGSLTLCQPFGIITRFGEVRQRYMNGGFLIISLEKAVFTFIRNVIVLKR
jgi:hypothetical protein